jgi:beta-glucosidase
MISQFDRRTMLVAGGATGIAAVLPSALRAKSAGPWPANFMWGVATAAHQIEGNNFSSDYWVLENIPSSNFKERSGDACDSWNRWREDIALVKALGLNTYRFSVEWARIEPEQGRFSNAAIAVYRQMCELCRSHGIVPIVTLHHFTSPIWLAAAGGWEDGRTPEAFARFAGFVARHLGDLAGAFCTMNEPNAQVNSWVMRNEAPYEADAAMMAEASKRVGSDRFHSYFMGNSFRVRDVCIAAHKLAVAALKSIAPDVPVGMTLALQDFMPLPEGQRLYDKIFAQARMPFYEAARGDDFLGVQTYMRLRFGETGYAPTPPGVMTNGSGNDVSPDALGATLREAWNHCQVPIIVTENGIETSDDAARIVHMTQSIAVLKDAISSGIPVAGYVHWSLLDNFEWRSGYVQQFGLFSVDRASFVRTPKPSASAYSALIERAGVQPLRSSFRPLHNR